jgi:hypothetical protein
MRQLGHKFRNCMVRLAEQWAIQQDTIVYEYTGPQLAVCALERDGAFGWRLDDLKAEGNAEVSRATRRDIRRRFAAAGIRYGAPLQELLRYW